MKIIAVILLAGSLLLGMAGCALTPAAPESSASAPAPSENGAEESTDAPAEDPESSDIYKDPEHPENVETESGELPPISGSEDFIAAFSGNLVDTAYLSDITAAATTADMVQVTSATASAWETQLNHAYTQLIEILEGEEKETLELEQSAWSNELPLALEELQSAEAAGGSLAKVDVAYKTMLLFRTRSAQLYEKLFEKTGEVPFYVASGEAVG